MKYDTTFWLSSCLAQAFSFKVLTNEWISLNLYKIHIPLSQNPQLHPRVNFSTVIYLLLGWIDSHPHCCWTSVKPTCLMIFDFMSHAWVNCNESSITKCFCFWKELLSNGGVLAFSLVWVSETPLKDILQSV